MQTNYEGDDTDLNGTSQSTTGKPWLAALFLLCTAAIWWAGGELFDVPLNPVHWFK